MSLITCSECNKEVSSKAKFCPHCGNPVVVKKPFISRTGCLLIILGFFFVILFSYIEMQSRNNPPTFKEGELQTLNDNFTKFINSGLLERFTPELNEAFVDPLEWNKYLYEDKRNIALCLAKLCYVKKFTANKITIKDNTTGKEIARYNSHGFEVY